MTTWAVLPVKPLPVGKSRLHACLSPREVYRLNRELLKTTFWRLKNCALIDKILVISRDDEVMALTKEWGGIALAEASPSSLNLAVNQAFGYIQKQGSGSVLVIPADLPQMGSNDLEEVIRLGSDQNFLVIVPDLHQSGTNALFMSQPGLIKPMFGRRSYQKHIKQALVNSIDLTVWLNKKIQSDLDTPQDLENYNKINLYSLEEFN